MDREQLAHEIARLVRVSHEDIRGDADLCALGLSSLDVLRIVNDYRVRGVPVTYRDLAEETTLDAWWARIERLLLMNPHLAA